MNAKERTFDLSEARQVGASLLDSGHPIRLKLGGNSMFPFLRQDDIATVVQVQISELKPGQIIVFEQGERWVAHRLVKIQWQVNKWVCLAQGDSTKKMDLPFSEKEYIGVIQNYTRNKQFYTVNHLIANVYGALMLSFRPLPQWFIYYALRVRNWLRIG